MNLCSSGTKVWGESRALEGPLKCPQKVLQGFKTETKELLGRTEEKSTVFFWQGVIDLPLQANDFLQKGNRKN